MAGAFVHLLGGEVAGSSDVAVWSEVFSASGCGGISRNSQVSLGSNTGRKTLATIAVMSTLATMTAPTMVMITARTPNFSTRLNTSNWRLRTSKT